MTVEEMNTKLYDKMYAEQEEFEQKLLSMEPREVLDHAYEYYIREDMLIEMEVTNLSGKQCRALLKLKAPLTALYDRWLEIEDSHMEEIHDMIESYAEDLVREEQIRADMDAR